MHRKKGIWQIFAEIDAIDERWENHRQAKWQTTLSNCEWRHANSEQRLHLKCIIMELNFKELEPKIPKIFPKKQILLAKRDGYSVTDVICRIFSINPYTNGQKFIAYWDFQCIFVGTLSIKWVFLRICGESADFPKLLLRLEGSMNIINVFYHIWCGIYRMVSLELHHRLC